MSTPTNIDPAIMKRLAYVRLLHQQGIDQSQLPEPLAFTCLLSFHDAAELFLIVAAEHRGAEDLKPKQQLKFMEYWGRLNDPSTKMRVILARKQGMESLNLLRNNFKHNGTLPGLPGIEQARRDVAAFFEENTRRVFDIEYEQIHMAFVIPQPETRKFVERAADLHALGKVDEAMAHLHYAFSSLFHQKLADQIWEPLSFPPHLEPRLSIELTAEALGGPAQLHGDYRLARQIERTTQAVQVMQQAMRVMATGINYPEYCRFNRYVPGFYGPTAEDPEIRLAVHESYAPTEQEYEFCLNFVVSSALRIAELEIALTPAWMNLGN